MLESLKKVFFILGRFRKRYFASLFIGAIAVSVDTMSIVYFGSLVASTMGRNELIDRVKTIAASLGLPTTLGSMVGILFLIYLVKSVLLVGFNRNISLFAYDLRAALQERLLRGVLSEIPYRQLSSNSTASFSQKTLLVAHSFSVELILQSSIGIINVATGALIFVYLLIINPRPTLVLAAVFIIIGLIYTNSVAKPLRAISHNMHTYMGRLTHMFLQSVYAAKEARIHKWEQNYVDLFRNYHSHINRNQLRYNSIHMAPRVMFEVLLCLSFLIFTAGSEWTGIPTDNLMTQFSIFLIAAMKMLPASSQLLNAVTTFNANQSSINVLFKELSDLDGYINTKNSNPENSVDCGDDWKDIVISDVCFSYEPNVPVLKNIFINISQGQVTGISGPSGGGKSTLLDIILGLLQPDSGRVRVGGRDIFICKESWNRRIGYMSQNLFLIDDTLAANLLLAVSSPTLDFDRARTCLTDVGLQEFATPQGLEFRIGERGIRLSGGQRQRLVIARLLYSNKSVLVLDEPTASLDNRAEEAVIQCIQTLKNDRTIIVVSHSESLLKECNTVYEIRDGSAHSVLCADRTG